MGIWRNIGVLFESCFGYFYQTFDVKPKWMSKNNVNYYVARSNPPFPPLLKGETQNKFLQGSEKLWVMISFAKGGEIKDFQNHFTSKV